MEIPFNKNENVKLKESLNLEIHNFKKQVMAY